jgi:hypothetical protein
LKCFVTDVLRLECLCGRRLKCFVADVLRLGCLCDRRLKCFVTDVLRLECLCGHRLKCFVTDVGCHFLFSQNIVYTSTCKIYCCIIVRTVTNATIEHCSNHTHWLQPRVKWRTAKKTTRKYSDQLIDWLVFNTNLSNISAILWRDISIQRRAKWWYCRTAF